MVGWPSVLGYRLSNVQWEVHNSVFLDRHNSKYGVHITSILNVHYTSFTPHLLDDYASSHQKNKSKGCWYSTLKNFYTCTSLQRSKGNGLHVHTKITSTRRKKKVFTFFINSAVQINIWRSSGGHFTSCTHWQWPFRQAGLKPLLRHFLPPPLVHNFCDIHLRIHYLKQWHRTTLPPPFPRTLWMVPLWVYKPRQSKGMQRYTNSTIFFVHLS